MRHLFNAMHRASTKQIKINKKPVELDEKSEKTVPIQPLHVQLQPPDVCIRYFPRCWPGKSKGPGAVRLRYQVAWRRIAGLISRLIAKKGCGVFRHLYATTLETKAEGARSQPWRVNPRGRRGFGSRFKDSKGVRALVHGEI